MGGSGARRATIKKNRKGQTALMIASEERQMTVVQLLFNHANIDINLKNKSSRTALDIACRVG